MPQIAKGRWIRFNGGMTLIPVSSSAINAVGYDAGTLTIEFNNGRIYDFPDVPESVFCELMSASSKGAFYNEFIRGNYK
jgi:hypothetical protein